ncbi:MAG TPA: hypothetical protein VHU40_16200, partial [Polyangia bacterium]|nr:hypothetical protein [Polyangia bacterium]
MSAAPVRFVLFGVLSAALLALLIAAANVVSARPARVAAPPEEAVEQPPAPARPRSRSRPPLPSVTPAACTPRPGWACWRGSLRLPPAVRSTWQSAVSEDQAEEMDLSEAVPERGHVPAAAAVLPPEASFALFFDVELIRSNDDSDEPRPDGQVIVFSDGSFEAHVPPGRYDLDVSSHDGFVVGGLESLSAVAGAIETGIEIPLASAVAIEGHVVDEDGISTPMVVSLTRQGHDGTTITSLGPDGSFRSDGLRPGTYVVSAATGRGDEHVDREVTAPARAIELRVPRAVDGLLLLPRSS